MLLTVDTELLTVVNADVTGRFVSKEPSPTKRPKIVPAEIVEKKPYVVDITDAEILLAVRRPVLNEFVLRTAGTIKGTFVSNDPSPICLP